MLGCFCYLNVFQVKFSPQKRCQRVSWGQGSAGSPPAAVVWVPVALSLLSEIWIQKKANTKPEATAKLPVMYLCCKTAAVTQQQPFSLWASQLIHSHIYSSCVREGPNPKNVVFFYPWEERLGVISMYVTGYDESAIFFSMLKQDRNIMSYNIAGNKSKSLSLTRSLH